MKKKRHILLIALLVIGLSFPNMVLPQQKDYLNNYSGSLVSIVFGATLPSSVFRTITVPAGNCVDIEIFARDCCIRDDVVEIRIGGCLLATIDSRSGAFGTHPGETHTLSVGPGTHTIEYRNVFSSVGPSGWLVSETIKPFTGKFICGGGPPATQSLSAGLPSCGNTPVDVSLRKLKDDAGNEIEIKCVNLPVDEYRVFFTPLGGTPKLVGRCPFERGCNSGVVFHTGDTNPANGNPDCFINSRWTSKDQQYGDLDDDGDGKKDSWIYTYDVVKDKAKRENYESSSNPVLVFIDERTPDLNDPPPTPQILPQGGPMEVSPFQPCDLNSDGVCDARDGVIFESALGSSRGDTEYNPDADFDGDGSVTNTDQQLLFPEGIPESIIVSIQEVIDELQDIVNDPSMSPVVVDKVEDALAKAQTALDELNKTPPDNQAAVGNIEGTVGDLEAALGLDPALDPDLIDLMDQLAGIARRIAEDAIDQAIAAGGDPQTISEAQQSLAAGDAARQLAQSGQLDKFKEAVNKYKDALAKAESALSKRTVSGEHEPNLPESYALHQNYPNPFNPETEIRFQIPEANYVVVRIFNTLGQEIRTLVDGEVQAGHHSVRWDSKDNNGNLISSGVYFYQLQSGNFSQTKKMILLR